FISHGILPVAAAVDGVRRTATVDILVLNQLGPAEEGNQFMKLFALPRFGAGVMALGTLQLHAQEHAARRGGNFHWVAVQGRQVIDRSALIVYSGGGYQSTDDVAPGPIPADLFDHPLI